MTNKSIIKIRKAKLSDRKDIFSLVKEFSTSFNPEEKIFEESLSKLLTNEFAFINVAECEGKIVGYCLGFDHETFYANGKVSWVEEIMVAKDYRKLGVGKMLMEEFEGWSVSRKSKLIALATRRASSFYEALDYEESAVYYRKLL